MSTILAVLAFLGAMAPIVAKLLSMHDASEQEENVKEKALATTEVDELDASINAIDKRLRGD